MKDEGLFDTYAFRFSAHGIRPRLIYLVQRDFQTPQDCFIEGTVAHWTDNVAKTMTWGKVAGPIDLQLSTREFARFMALAKKCDRDVMRMVIAQSVKDLLKNQPDED